MNHLLARPRFIFWLCCTIILSGFLILWWQNDKDITRFIIAGSKFTSAANTPVPIYVYEGTGFDGQIFFRYALNPFSMDNPQYGIRVDAPHYRHPRIMYPLLVWIVSGGQAPMVPYAMVLLNILAYAGICLLSLRLGKIWNAPIQRVLVMLFIPGLWMCLSRNMAELTEGVFFMLSVWAFSKQRKLLFAFAICAMLFSRESSCIVVLALIPVALFSKAGAPLREHWRAWVVPVIAPVLLLAVFRWWCYRFYDAAPDLSQIAELIPLKGWKDGLYLQYLQQGSWSAAISSSWMMLSCLSVAIFFFSLKPLLNGHQKDVVEFWLYLIVISWVVIMPFLSIKVWIQSWGFCRAFTIPMLACGLLWIKNGSLPKKSLT